MCEYLGQQQAELSEEGMEEDRKRLRTVYDEVELSMANLKQNPGKRQKHD
jgi:hypothetical protein